MKLIKNPNGLLLILAISIIIDSAIGDSNTTDPFYPCQSSVTSGQWSVVCHRVPANKVKAIFTKVKSPFNIAQLLLTPSGQDYQIISNIIGNHSISAITLNCPNRNNNPLVVQPNAFTQTQSFTTELNIEKCDLRQLNWSFLKGFSNLHTLSVQYSSNIHLTFNTFPSNSLKSLTTIFWYSIVGIGKFNSQTKFPAPLISGLTKLKIWSCDELGTDSLNIILKKWITPASQSTLSNIQLAGLNLTKIPSEVSKYVHLNTLYFSENINAMTIQTGALNFTSPVSFMYFNAANVNSISPGAFTGDFKNALVVMVSNKLKTLESGIFKTMLEQMTSSNGYLDVANNPIDCSSQNICNLAWLTRDNPNLLDAVWSAKCSNGTYLYNLNPKELRGPNGKTCPKSQEMQINAVDTTSGAAGVPDLFAPCKSTKGLFLNVVCNRVPVVEVKNVFGKVKDPYYIYSLLLIPNVKDTKIIANTVGNHTISALTISCPARKKNPLLVDSAAFTVTKSVTSVITITGCDLKLVDWSFLKGFSRLFFLSIQYSSNFHTTFYTMPASTFTSLTFVSLYGIDGMNGFNDTSLKFPPPVPNGLSAFWVWFSYDLTTAAVQNLLATWVTPTSTNTLANIVVGGNNLTTIPPDVSKYTKTNDVNFWDNSQPMIIQSGAFNYTTPVQSLLLESSQITSVSPGAFIGDFKNALVSLYANQLTTLNASAFQPILSQMQTANGYLDVGANPLDCSANNICNLAWLIRDNRYLLDSAWTARCSNGTYLFQLNPQTLRGPNGKWCQ